MLQISVIEDLYTTKEDKNTSVLNCGYYSRVEYSLPIQNDA